ncbi:apyrase isoform X2 [Copidosoma floridanum]|nr:apyrase isoform X2 [Copidosoma floridanum]
MTTSQSTSRLLHEYHNSRRSRMLGRDWRQALRTPHIYRVGNSTLRIQSHFLVFLLFLVIACFVYYGYPLLKSLICVPPEHMLQPRQYYNYNKTYPLTPASKQFTGVSYKIAIVSDRDTNSKSTSQRNLWQSNLIRGNLMWMSSRNFISVTWDKAVVALTSDLNMKGRGMELSELVTFDGRLLTFDDRSGVTFFLEGDNVYPWVILMDGNGRSKKGFKSEWATVKDELLYVGSMGKEWTTSTGEFVHNDPMWVKVISPNGEVYSRNWKSNFKHLREAIGIEYPGYMIHESGAWSDVHKKWFFLPRRCSKEKYDEKIDETMACNVLLIADEKFVNIKVVYVGSLVPIRGFSSFKFLPDSNDSIIVALKTEEYLNKTATYITAFNIDGQIIMPDLHVADEKFEGLEFV